MEVFVKDCIACLLKQGITLIKKANIQDPEIEDRIILQILDTLKDYKKYRNAPEMSYLINKIVTSEIGIDDLYYQEKKQHIKKAFKLLPKIEQYVGKDLKRAIKFSCIGNSMDSGVYDELDISNWLFHEKDKDLYVDNTDIFIEKLENSNEVLIIGDNSGESVFDSLLVKLLSQYTKVLYAVREKPIINDITREEAIESNIHKYAEIINSGSPLPGADLRYCNNEFKKIFNEADLIISKGQGNFESLYNAERDIFFALKAKCDIISNYTNIPQNEYMFKYKKNAEKFENKNE